jgi:hypothetical protein
MLIGVFSDLALDGIGEVDLELVAKEKQEGRNVGDFLFDAFLFGGAVEIKVVRVLPQKELLKLGGFDRECRGQIFGIVKLLPVACVPKGDELLYEAI